MSKSFWLCLSITVVQWIDALANAVLYVMASETIRLIAFLLCAVMATLFTHITASAYSTDREMREWRR
jgi:hypothetical protein